MANAIASQVQALYVGYLGRAADQAGLDFWTNAITAGTSTIESVALGFTLSQEYTSKYEGLSNEELAAAIYQNVLGRAADADGLAFWVGELEKGVQTPETLLAAMINSLGAVDQQTIDNKVFVANAYSAAAGADYNVAAGAQIIAGVDSSAASVSAALQQLDNGELAGLVPGLNLFNAIANAEAEVVAYGKEVAAANAKLDTDKDGVVEQGEVQTAYNTAVAVRAGVDGGTSTAVLKAKLSDANDALAAAKAEAAAVDGAASAKLIADFEAAVAARAALEANPAADLAAAKAGLDTEILKDGGLTYGDGALTGITNIGDLYTALTNPLASAKSIADLAAAIKDVAYGSQLNTFAAQDLKIAQADAKVLAAEAGVAAIGESTSGAADGEGQAYIDAIDAQEIAAGLVDDAVEADADVAALKPILDKLNALEAAVVAADKALDDFAGEAKVNYDDLQDDVDAPAADVVNDVFYFSDVKVADVTIGAFGVEGNDYIILGEGYALNSGALTAGNNNALEIFFVQNGEDAQVVIENTVYGSGTITADADGVLTQPAGEQVTVITLTGVDAAALSFDNGIISVA